MLDELYHYLSSPSNRALVADRLGEHVWLALVPLLVGLLVAVPLGGLGEIGRNMAVFDLALGSGAMLAPDATLRVIGHEQPSDDARELFRRCGPIWLTFAAAHLIADRRGEPRDWWALAWLRGTELFTDVLWSR